MDLNEAIRTLYEERKQIDRLIAKLERRKRLCPGTPRRRRRMPAAKRLEVSRRMKEYWAARRLQPPCDILTAHQAISASVVSLVCRRLPGAHPRHHVHQPAGAPHSGP